ncbi:17899_t:CDS:2 [Funneliformis caledonium]|uniref:17899_t:CDS:1 n=1 Tax=Funneliformis caledonium TaxID=1117310 RepID=A0A9N8V9V4_9GLOM|nr:17899_t:CDS:2 [Funneliformis caledonium]
MPRSQEIREEQVKFLKTYPDPRPLNFFVEFKYRKRLAGYNDYSLCLDNALKDAPESEKLLDLRKNFNGNDYKDDWKQYEDWKKRETHASFHTLLDDGIDGGKSKRTNENPTENEDIGIEDVDNSENEVGKFNEAIVDVLGNAVEYSELAEKICSIYTEQYPDGDLIDLRPCSSFFKMLPRSIAKSYLSEMDIITESLIPDDVHQFLVQFFSQNISDNDWQIKIDDLRSSEQNNLITALVRILRRTLPQFVKAFSLGAQNPLQSIATIEQAHLNAFVHPCLDSALWNVAKIHYEYGEIPSKNHINKNRADGPVAKQDKEIADAEKIARNLKKIFSKIVKEVIKNRRRLPKRLFIFDAQSFRLRLHLYYLDYCGNFRLNEVDNANLPRDFSEMQDFVYFYECILKWALLVQDVIKSFDDARSEKRPSRFSYANSLLQLDE